MALRLAEQGRFTARPNPCVGCVIVRDGKVVGEGYHRFAGGDHAEVVALRQAGAAARDSTVYVTLEPCSHTGRTPPCVAALIAARPARVVMAIQDPDPRVNGAGLSALREHGIAVTTGVLAHEAEALNRGYFSRMVRGRPWMRSKVAASLDGRTALANGRSRWITGTAARAQVQRLRASHGAVLTGIGTILSDDPALTVRDVPVQAGEDFRQPCRVIVDSRLRLPSRARTLQFPGPVWVVTTRDPPAREWGEQVAVLCCEAGRDNRVSLPRMCRLLAGRGINEVLVEAGPTLNGALLQARLLDEIIIYLAPHVLGDRARGVFALGELTSMAERVALKIDDVRPVGEDWRITATPVYRE